MARPNNSTLLLPFMAVLALIFPFAFGSKQAHTAEGSQPDVHGASPHDEEGEEKQDVHDIRAILTAFFGKAPLENRISGYQLDFLIMTVPDPVDSRLPYLFDRNLTAIQRAAEVSGYVLDRFDLPWLEEIRARASASKGSDSTGLGPLHDHHHQYQKDPGFLLFNNPDKATALVVLLVGETPTTGVQKDALFSALYQAWWLCDGQLPDPAAVNISKELKADLDMAKAKGFVQPPSCEEIKILGPAFSGSAQSLDFVLHSWRWSRPDPGRTAFRIVSGSATAVHTTEPHRVFDFSEPAPPAGQSNASGNDTAAPKSSFFATVARDSVAIDYLLDYLRASRAFSCAPLRVALLTEGNTLYGSSLRMRPKGGQAIPCPDPTLVVNPVDLPFPLHISRLRSESEKARQERAHSQQEPATTTSSFSLPLPTEDDSGDAQDSVPPVSQLDVSSSELMLSNLLTTISREQFQYVGIAATDVRDVIFLSREVHEHSPATVIFALNADLIYTHPQAYPDTRGMLVVTPYPLFTLNQSWLQPVDEEAPGIRRIQFPDQATEGIYNAALSLLHDPKEETYLLEYASPFHPYGPPTAGRTNFDAYSNSPPLWIMTVGRDGFWPVAIQESEERTYDGYTLRAKPVAPQRNSDSAPKCGIFRRRPCHPLHDRSNRGIVPQFTFAALIVWSFFCLAPAVMFLSQFNRRHRYWGRLARLSDWLASAVNVSEIFALSQPDAKCFFLIGGTASLSVYALAITAYCLSAIGTWSLIRWVFTGTMFVILAVGLAACVQLFADILRCTLKPPAEPCGSAIVSFNRRWYTLPILGGVLLAWIGTLVLIGFWVRWLFWPSGTEMITGFRALNLQNGVSPLVPLFCVAAAAILWVFCSLQRLTFLQFLFEPSEYRPPASDPPKTPRPQVAPDAPATPPLEDDSKACRSTYFYSDVPFFGGLRALELRLRDIIECPTLLSAPESRATMILVLAVAFFWGGYLFFYRLVYAFETRPFYWVLGLTFLLVTSGILSNVLRVFLVWREIRSILHRLGRLPMREAFTRFRDRNRTLPRMTLATAPLPLTSLSVSLVAAQDLLESSDRFKRLLSKNEYTAYVIGEKADVKNARTSYLHALQCDASKRRKECEELQSDAQRELNCFTREVEDLLVQSWTGSGTGDEATDNSPVMLDEQTEKRLKEQKKRKEKARADLEEQAEEFLVSRTVDFLSHMFPQLTNLASYSMGCLFLMLMAISSYPLQPKNPFAYFCWFIIFSFVGVVLHMAIQMNRDAVLSCLNGTKPGEIHWDAGFIGRIIFLLVVPVLGLVGIQFPDAISQILRWVAPAGSGHP